MKQNKVNSDGSWQVVQSVVHQKAARATGGFHAGVECGHVARRTCHHDNVPNMPQVAKAGAIDRDNGLPLHLQIRRMLQRQITDGSYRPGEPFPTERELGERFRVSRTTVREAVVGLVDDGFLVRQQGKGTFVARTRDTFDATRLSSFSEDMQRRGLSTRSRVLSLREEVPTGDAALHFGPDVQRVLRIDRLRFADDEPISLQRSFLPLPRFAFTLGELENASLYELLETHHGVVVRSAEEVISAEGATTADARLLNVHEGAPLLCVLRFAFSQTGSAIECVNIRYRADRYRFSVQQRRGA
jgi:GntR family transcriptional regulator